MTTEANGEFDEESSAGFDPADHRAFVREINRSLALAYGYGGGLVLVAVVGVIVAAWLAGWIWSPVTWLGAVTVGLIGMTIVRMVVYRRVDRLYDRLESYCRANNVAPDLLRDHYDDEHLYPYFQALFELKERRKRIHNGESSDDSSMEETSSAEEAAGDADGE